MYIFFFGSPRLEKDQQPVPLQRRKTVALLAYLAVTGQAHSRDALATLLWPEYDQTGARANLRRDLSRLREALGDGALDINRTEVSLKPQIWSDTAVFTTNLALVRQHEHPPPHLCPECLAALTEATTLYSGDFMAGFSLPDSPEFDRWQFFQTESLRRLLAEALQQLVQWHIGQGEFEPAITHGRRWLALDPLHEPAHRQLMQLYAWSGQYTAALRQYQECTQLLQDELALSPEAETTALYEAVRTRQLAPPPTGTMNGPEPVAALSPPQERYQQEELLAVGGHGELYLGQDRLTGQTVVIKRLRPELLTSDKEYVSRFIREGQLLRELDHPNIVKVLALFEQDGQHQIIMEHMPGGSLRHLLQQHSPLPLAQTLTIALELADALSRAHHLNIIHRDLKPENVLLAADGSPRLTDFGMGRLLRDDSLLTQSGLFMGSPAYMSPEALRGEELDVRSDIWSFGVLLYEALAGRRPFTGEQITPVVVRILNEPAPEIRQFRPDVPAPLSDLLQRMLVKERAERIGSIRLVAAALEAIRDGLALSPAHETLSPTTPFSDLPPFDSAFPLAAGDYRSKQQIRYSVSADGVRIASAIVGQGPVLVKAANWLSHLEYDWQSPVWQHWLAALSQNYTLVRYDERGCGLSDWDVAELSVDAFVRDLEGVVDSLGLARFPLLGISQGGPVALSYAVRHPERVSHLILYGAYGAGRFNRTYSPEQAEQAEAILQLIKVGWGKDNPAFRQFFTTLFMPEATAEQMHWFNDLQRHSASPEMAYRLEESFFHIDVGHLLHQVQTPTLILHGREDAVVPYAEGQQLAALIPDARFVTLESKNHILLPDEPAWQHFLEEVNRFLGQESAASHEGRIFTPRSIRTPTPLPDKSTRHNLPPQPTAFVGREREMHELRQWLLDEPANRLVTLVGPGGIGKTRLALAAAQSVLQAFPDGVFFVPLAPLANAAHLVAAIAESLRLQSVGAVEPRQQLLHYLRQKQLLLVMDNFEHLLEGAEMVADILQDTTAVKILVTSRERLHLSAESVYTLAGMTYPAWPTPPDNWDKTQLAAYDALQLLQQRRQLLRGEFPLQDSELAAMVHICHLVEGMPLALLLATSWLPLLSFSEIAAEIEQCLDFLEGDMRDLPERQRSVRATFDTSWKRLAAEEQQVFMKLSVFRGGFTRQAAQAVTGANLRTLRSLADKSLLSLSRRSRTSQGERCEIHELLRQYGEEALAQSGLAEATGQQHSDYYLGFLHEREADLKGRNQLEALAEIKADMQNIRQAWRRALYHQALTGLNLAMEALHLFYDLCTRQSEGSELFAKAYQQLAASGLEKTHPVLARLSLRTNFLGMFAATYPRDEMESALQESLVVLQQQEIEAEIAYCLGALGSYYNLVTVEPAKALPILQQSLARFRALEDGFFISRALQWVSLCHMQLGSMREFYNATQESVAEARRCGNQVDVVYSMVNLAEAAIIQGEYAAAKNNLQEVRTQAEALALHASMAYLDMLRSLLYCLEGDFERALPIITKACRLATDINYAIAVAFTSGMHALLNSLAGNDSLGRQLALESLAVTGNHGLGMILANWALAVVACNQQTYREARSFAHAALEIAYKSQYAAPMAWLLPLTAVILAGEQQKQRALELLSLAQDHPLSRMGWCSQWPLLAELQQTLKSERNETISSPDHAYHVEGVVEKLLAEWSGEL